ncbi:hypothetical protein [Thermococcus alcaliphilus]|uniref:hypothetical protein n=1 Tax=Thermococcus alcaliphilus TaxID=139207 RepID=UPI0020913460|nr:hypothetical protein [Thermococcus alcaliphilus]MCO6042112.1 hypothetical protein [Thermococcus alcaliphilus]
MIGIALSYLVLSASILGAALAWKVKGTQGSIMYLSSAMFALGFLLELTFPEFGNVIGFIGAISFLFVVLAFSFGRLGAWTWLYVGLSAAVGIYVVFAAVELLFPLMTLLFALSALLGIRLNNLLPWLHTDALATSSLFFFISFFSHLMGYHLVSEFSFFSGMLFGALQMFEGVEILKNIKKRSFSWEQT